MMIKASSPLSLQVQRGFRSVLVYLTALDSSSDFVAVGSSIGMLYLYCRRLAHMNKYSLEVRALLLSGAQAAGDQKPVEQRF